MATSWWTRTLAVALPATVLIWPVVGLVTGETGLVIPRRIQSEVTLRPKRRNQAVHAPSATDRPTGGQTDAVSAGYRYGSASEKSDAVSRCFAHSRHAALQRTAVGVDVVGYGKRDDDVQVFIRAAMYRILVEAFDESGIPWEACHHEDRGDGVLILAPPQIPSAPLLHPLVEYLRAGLRRYNKVASDQAQIKLRMAVHAGPIHTDDYGMTGHTLIHLFRILDAPAFKEAFAASSADLGLAASAYLYDTVIRHASGLIDPQTYGPLQIKLKETETTVWTNPELSRR